MAGSISIGKLIGGAISLGQLALAMRRMPAAIWVAQADGIDRGFKVFWTTLKPKMEIKSAGKKYTLTSPRLWPIEITTKPIPSDSAPDWKRFRARMGTDSTAALLLEEGGRVTPKNKRWLAIPVGGARTAGGRVRPNFSSPAKAKAKGHEFVTIRGEGGKLRLFELVKKKAGRGRPMKGAAPATKQPSPEAAYILVQVTRHRPRLHFHETFRSDYANFERRVGSTMDRAIRDVLAGRPVRVYQAKPKAVAA